jgi:hypothetical protein
VAVLLLAGSVFANGMLPGDVFMTVRTDTTTITGYGNASNEDVMALHPTSWTGGTIDGGMWSLYFDGTPRMASTQGIDALHIFDANSFIFSTGDPATVPYPGPGGVGYDDIDLIRYDVGSNTFTKFFDGSDHGLTSGMNVIGAAVCRDRLILSTYVGGELGGVNFDLNDLMAFTPNTPGDWNGSGVWSLFLDGSDIGLDSAVERIDGLHVMGGYRSYPDGEEDGPTSSGNGFYPTVLFSVDTIGGLLNANASNLAFDDEDVLAFQPISLGDNTMGSAYIWLDGNSVGLGNMNSETNSFSVFPIPEPMTVLLVGSGTLALAGWHRRRRLS